MTKTLVEVMIATQLLLCMMQVLMEPRETQRGSLKQARILGGSWKTVKTLLSASR